MSRLTALMLRNGSNTDFLLRVVKEALCQAREEHPQPYVDGHHLLGVLREEVHGLELEIFKKHLDPEALQGELLQIAAVAIRGIEDLTLERTEQ